MRTLDFTPLFRSTVGFDRLFDMLDSVAQYDTNQSYPPYNIERSDETHYRISVAVAMCAAPADSPVKNIRSMSTSYSAACARAQR